MLEAYSSWTDSFSTMVKMVSELICILINPYSVLSLPLIYESICIGLCCTACNLSFQRNFALIVVSSILYI